MNEVDGGPAASVFAAGAVCSTIHAHKEMITIT